MESISEVINREELNSVNSNEASSNKTSEKWSQLEQTLECVSTIITPENVNLLNSNEDSSAASLANPPEEPKITQQMMELVLEPELALDPELVLNPEEDINEDPTSPPEFTTKTADDPNLEYNWRNPPRLLCSATQEYQPNEVCENFTKGCLWSPDGTCLLVPGEDFRLRVYELPAALYSGKIPEAPLPHLIPVFNIKDGGVVYDSSWYPLMNSWQPETCCFISTSKETPVHLWDAFTGQLRATYRAYNQ